MRWTPNQWIVPTLLVAALAIVVGVANSQPPVGGIVAGTPTTTTRPSLPSTTTSPLGLRSSSLSSPRCVVVDGLPDSRCTPGAVAVSDVKVLCARGYRTSSVRPSTAYIGPLKRRQIAQYGAYAGRSARGYEEDHLIPLEIGGDPRSPANLWPEALQQAHVKDKVEDAAKRAACTGKIDLGDAQASMARDWRALGVRLGVPGLH
jgi:hypothetical protein